MNYYELWLIRHAKTEENAKRIMIGLTDPPLSLHGQRDADALGQRLANLPAGALYSSSLLRAQTTAEIIATWHEPVLSVQSTPLLRELHFGVLEGVSLDDANIHHKALMDAAWDPKGDDYAFPGGERRGAAVERFEQFLRTEINSSSPLPIWVVTHGAMIGLWLSYHQGMPLGAFRTWQPRHASITKVGIERAEDGNTKRVTILDYNDVRHLENGDGR